jgi:hypothetical protein
VAVRMVASSECLDGCARESERRGAPHSSILNCDSVDFGGLPRGSRETNGCLTQALNEVSAALAALGCHADR